MTCNSGMYKNSKNWIKMKMKTPIHLNNKGNEVIAWCLLNVWSCLLLSNHCHCTCHCHQCLLHHICVNQVNNDDIHQSPKVISGDKNIHLLSGVAREKVGDIPMNMSSTLQINSYGSILKCIVNWCTFTPTPGHQSEWILKLSTAWPHWQCERWIKTKGFKLESYDLLTNKINIIFHWLAWKKSWFKTSLISSNLLSSSIIFWTKINVSYLETTRSLVTKVYLNPR
jgi:hypothetical protein